MKPNIERPCVDEVKKYLKKWNEYEKYRCQEKSVVMVYQQYPKNTKIEEVLIKVGILNDFYSTNIRDTFAVAQHIVAIGIDKNLDKEDINIVDKIARVCINGKNKRLYSFATKYCSHHNPNFYPIYDSKVDKVLMYFKSQEEFAVFEKEDLRDYPSFRNIVLKFREHYKLEKYSLREQDYYLWLFGKEHFA